MWPRYHAAAATKGEDFSHCAVRQWLAIRSGVASSRRAPRRRLRRMWRPRRHAWPKDRLWGSNPSYAKIWLYEAKDPMKLASIEAPESEPPARIVVAEPLAAPLARGLAVIPYYTENVRILPVYGAAALGVVPRVGHVHVTVDDSPWHWVDASGEAIVVQGLAPGAHRILLELADPTHRVIDRGLVTFEIPPR
jgi:hypothetical protein